MPIWSSAIHRHHNPEKTAARAKLLYALPVPQQENAPKIGMYLTHNGVVRRSAKAQVRFGAEDTLPVCGMLFSYDQERVDRIIAETYRLQVGDDIMYVLIGGDIRPYVVDALQYLVGRIKNECVTETELH